MHLGWMDQSTTETRFVLERATATGRWTAVGLVQADVTTFDDLGLQPGTPYSYRVQALGPSGASAWSNVATARTPSLTVTPAAPSRLEAQATSGSSVRLTWVDNADDESGFALQRALDREGPWAAVTTVAGRPAGPSRVTRARQAKRVADSIETSTDAATAAAAAAAGDASAAAAGAAASAPLPETISI